MVFNNCDYTTDAHIRLHKDVVEVESQVLHVCRRAYEEGMCSLYAANTFEYGYLNDDMQEIELFDRGHSLLVSEDEWSSRQEPADGLYVILPGNPPKRRYRKQHYFSVLPLKSRNMIRSISIASPRFYFNQFGMFRNLKRVVFTYPRYIYWNWKLSRDSWPDTGSWTFLWDDYTEDEFLENFGRDNIQQTFVERSKSREQDRDIHRLLVRLAEDVPQRFELEIYFLVGNYMLGQDDQEFWFPVRDIIDASRDKDIGWRSEIKPELAFEPQPSVSSDQAPTNTLLSKDPLYEQWETMEEEDCGRVQDAYRSKTGAFAFQPAYLPVQVHVAAPQQGRFTREIETDIIRFNTLEAVKDVFTSSLSHKQSLTSVKKMMRTPSFGSSIVASAGLLSSSTLPTGARPVCSSPAASPLEDSMMERFNHDDGALEDTMTTFDSQDLANSSTDAQLKGYSKDTKSLKGSDSPFQDAELPQELIASPSLTKVTQRSRSHLSKRRSSILMARTSSLYASSLWTISKGIRTRCSNSLKLVLP
ncbi:hypothetical protein LTR90_003162 [Exophiala xenobiotica]|nr:hypothetical protein LTR90_003162 [Exophiala xenobiotica]